MKTFGRKFLHCFTCKTLSYDIFENYYSDVIIICFLYFNNMDEIEDSLDAPVKYPLFTLCIDMIGEVTDLE